MSITAATLMLLHASEPALTPNDVSLASRLELAVRYRQLEAGRPALALPLVLCIGGLVLSAASLISLFAIREPGAPESLFRGGSPMGEVLVGLSVAGAAAVPIGAWASWRALQYHQQTAPELAAIEVELLRRNRDGCGVAGRAVMRSSFSGLVL